MASDKVLEEVIATYDNNTKPVKYLSVQDSVAPKFQEKLKDVYDFAHCQIKRKSKNALSELVIQDFDEEQIWQQLEMKNNDELTDLSGVVHQGSAEDKLKIPNEVDPNNKQLSIDELNSEGDDKKSDDEEEEDEDEKDEEINKEEIEDEGSDVDMSGSDDSDDLDRILKKRKNNNEPMKRTNKPSIVDDKFFKLDELDNFLNKEDDNYMKKELNGNYDQNYDFFNDDLSSEEDEDPENARMLKYTGFFDSPESGDDDETSKNNDKIEKKDRKRKLSETKLPEKRVKFNFSNNSDDDDDDDDDDDSIEKAKNNDDNDNGGIKSSLENRQERLKHRIEQFEKEAITEKPWQLKGEITATKRPENSLLEEFVQVDFASRPAPIITEQTTLKLEDIIKQRIKDKAWDSVVRKYKPVETPKEYKKKLVMDQEKSQKSLAQIYEDEYVKQKAALNPNDDDERQEEEPKEHIEIRELMHSLFRKLDALSNFHYTPKLAQPEIKIISNIPAINMEEVAPIATTDATLLAPEEVMKKPRGDIIGKTERTKTDMNRARRKKKVMQKVKQQAIEKKQELMKDGPIKNKKQAKVIQAAMVKKLTKDRNISTINESTNKNPKSSTAFFSQLQDQVSSSIKSKTGAQIKKKNKSVHSAKKLKL